MRHSERFLLCISCGCMQRNTGTGHITTKILAQAISPPKYWHRPYHHQNTGTGHITTKIYIGPHQRRMKSVHNYIFENSCQQTRTAQTNKPKMHNYGEDMVSSVEVIKHSILNSSPWSYFPHHCYTHCYLHAKQNNSFI